MSIANEGPVSIDEIDDRVLALCISRSYKKGMSEDALYECTRGVWRLSRERAEEAKYIFAVFEGTILDVYAADHWDVAFTTPYDCRTFTEDEQEQTSGRRYEFVRKTVPNEVRTKYRNRQMVVRFFGPVRYINWDDKR